LEGREGGDAEEAEVEVERLRERFFFFGGRKRERERKEAGEEGKKPNVDIHLRCSRSTRRHFDHN
jgi:hypothetical protein